MAHTGLRKVHSDDAVRGVLVQGPVVRGEYRFDEESGARNRARDFQNRRRRRARFHVRLRQLDRARFILSVNDPQTALKISISVVVVALLGSSNECVSSLNVVRAPVAEQRRQVLVDSSLYIDTFPDVREHASVVGANSVVIAPS